MGTIFDTFFVMFICMSLAFLLPIILYRYYIFYNANPGRKLSLSEKEAKQRREEPIDQMVCGTDESSNLGRKPNPKLTGHPGFNVDYSVGELERLDGLNILISIVEKCKQNSKPVHIHQSGFKQLGKKWCLDYFKEVMKGEKVSITQTKNSVLNYFFASGMKEKKMTWDDFILDGIRRSKSKNKGEKNQKNENNEKNEVVYYNAQNELPDKLKNDMQNDENSASFYSSFNDITGKNMVRTENLVYWFGFERYFTPLHYDHEDGLLCCLHGKKDVWLLDPKYTDRLGASDVFVYSDVFDIRKRNDLPGRYRIMMKPGDVLFIPQGWWHHVESIPNDNVAKSGDVNVPYHLAVTFWLYPRDEDYSFKTQLDKIGKKQGKEFKEVVRVSDLSENDKKRLESTGFWSPSDGNDKKIENPLFTDKYD